jgi:N-acetyl-gamma-glutamyl-phosphate reductase
MSHKRVNVLFTPHLTPMTRGILSTIYINLKELISVEDVRKIYETVYKNEHFIKILKPDFWPKTKLASGTNNCYINFTINADNKKLIVVSAIDNLIKGASGQAVQNMNILFGLDEKTGLADTAIYP